MQAYEGCAGMAGAEPHAWETGLEAGYHVYRSGCAQGDDSGGAGRGGLAGRRARVWQDREHAGCREGGGCEVGAQWPRVAVLLRSWTLRLWHSATTDSLEARLHGGRSLADSPQTWRADQDRSARCDQPRQAASGW